jgi:hypothetical protein
MKVAAVMAAAGLVLAACGDGAGDGDETEMGAITGRASFSGGDSNAGIIVTIEKVEGQRTASLVQQEAGRAVTSQGTKTTTDGDGNFTFEKVPAGNYTVYASSRDSREKAIAQDVAVAAGRAVTVEGLELTPVGHLSGTVTVDGKTTGNLGTLVFIAGTSYAAWTDDAGAFTISDVPATSGYSVVVSRDGVSGVWKSADVVKGETTAIGTKNIETDNLGNLTGLRIIYDGNHYNFGALPVDTTVYKTGDTVSVADPDDPNSDKDLFGREGWAFVGWNTKPDGTGTAYFPASWHITQYTSKTGNSWSSTEGDLLNRDRVTFEDSDITLYAIWDICWFNIEKDGQNNLSAVIHWRADAAVVRQNLEIPASINTIPVTAIQPWAFMQCELARTLIVPDTSIGDFAFIGMIHLETVTLSKNITEIGLGVFANTNVVQITLGANVTINIETEDWWDNWWWVDGFVQDYTAGGKKAGTYHIGAFDEVKGRNVWILE